MVDIYRMCHLLHLKIKCLLCGICCLASFTWRTNIFRVYAHSERSFHIPLSQTSLSPIFQPYFFQVPDIQSNLTTVHNECRSTLLAISPSKQSELNVYSRFCLLEDFLSPFSFRVTIDWCCKAAAVLFK